MNKETSAPFPCKKYQIIYADPPWTYEKTGGLTNSRGMAKQFYETMSWKDICSLPVKDISCDNACLFLWVTYPKLPEGLEVIRAWGFQYFGLGFEWIKKTKTGKDFFGMGYWTRANSEPCLLGFRGKLRPKRHDIRQIVESEINEHSKKPNEIREKIINLVGDLPRIELFARQKINGWDAWGNEI
jgi:site-specific DNA-methyltransferase (adenine-specific)